MEKRRPVYESLAAIHILTDDKKSGEVASEIMATLEANEGELANE
jgi:shikimate kinase